jgi:hypothetical protein
VTPPTNSELIGALAACIELIEGWAYGPVFRKAGVQWPEGVCTAPALVEAKRLVAMARQ